MFAGCVESLVLSVRAGDGRHKGETYRSLPFSVGLQDSPPGIGPVYS